MIATDLIFTFRRFSRSRMKSNMAWLKWPSCGEVRKNHLSPRSVRAGDDDSAFRCGMPLRSATCAIVWVTPEKYAPNSACTFSWVTRRSASA